MHFNRQKFRSLREPKMTQAQLAERLGVEPPTVTQWESGRYKPSPRRYAAIAAALRCSVSDFCDDEPAPSSFAPPPPEAPAPPAADPRLGAINGAWRGLPEKWRAWLWRCFLFAIGGGGDGDGDGPDAAPAFPPPGKGGGNDVSRGEKIVCWAGLLLTLGAWLLALALGRGWAEASDWETAVGCIATAPAQFLSWRRWLRAWGRRRAAARRPRRQPRRRGPRP